jgi:hypothetical protein
MKIKEIVDALGLRWRVSDIMIWGRSAARAANTGKQSAAGIEAEWAKLDPLATFRRKIGGFMDFDQWRDAKRSPSEWPTGSAGRKIAGADLWD